MLKTLLLLLLTAMFATACGTQTQTPTEAPIENYPAPLESEASGYPAPQEQTGDAVYPSPHNTVTPLVPLSDAYPAPQDGMEVFVIVPGESTVTYEVGEVFLNQNNAFNLAVGTTSEVNGEIFVDRANPQNSSLGPIAVDISQFTSDSQRRDNAIRERFLESTQFPIAIFNPTEIQGLPGSYQEGEPISFQVTGDLTVRGVSRPVTFDVTLVGEGNTMTGEATSMILMSDFGVGPISIAGILNTEDEVNVKFTFVAQQ
jgi:polyisoprenoid-binding protein YceI